MNLERNRFYFYFHFRDILRIFPRTKLIILSPETICSNNSIRFDTPINIYKDDRTKHEQNRSYSGNLNFMNSNGVETQSHESFGLIKKGALYLNKKCNQLIVIIFISHTQFIMLIFLYLFQYYISSTNTDEN